MMIWNKALKMFTPKEQWFLEKAAIEEDTRELRNPAIGWYQIFTFPLDKPFSPDVIQTCLLDKEELALLLIDIGEYRNQALDSEALNRLRSILQFFREQKKEMIIRLTYDTIGKGMEHEPTHFEQVQRHILQVTAVLRDFLPEIYIIQGILVGSWGEMHNSRYLSPNRIVSILEMLNSQLDEKVYLSVRKPSFYRLVRSQDEWDITPEKRIGLFNDGIFGSDSDLGTYGTQTLKEAGWEQAWSTEDEIRFQEVLCATVPNGGEVIHPEGKPMSLSQTVERLKRMHISYLNDHYDGRLLDYWKGQTWNFLDEWNGMNGLDYIGRHLGYRFRILDIQMNRDFWNNSWSVTVIMDNIGFSACYFPIKIALTQNFGNGSIRVYEQEINNANLDSGHKAKYTFEVEPSESLLSLKVLRISDGRIIQLGTTGQFSDDGLILGKIMKTER